MKRSLDKLQKFYTLEAGRDYDNKAVIGRLESMLEPDQPLAIPSQYSTILIFPLLRGTPYRKN